MLQRAAGERSPRLQDRPADLAAHASRGSFYSRWMGLQTVCMNRNALRPRVAVESIDARRRSASPSLLGSRDGLRCGSEARTARVMQSANVDDLEIWIESNWSPSMGRSRDSSLARASAIAVPSVQNSAYLCGDGLHALFHARCIAELKWTDVWQRDAS